MSNNEMSASVMLSVLHIDRGVNFASELEVIFKHLESNPNEFNSEIAARLVLISRMVRGCFHQCYNNYEHSHPEIDIDSLVDDTKFDSVY